MTPNHINPEENSTLRLLMPQWQGGGNRPAYHLGAQLLAWLAPASTQNRCPGEEKATMTVAADAIGTRKRVMTETGFEALTPGERVERFGKRVERDTSRRKPVAVSLNQKHTC